MESAIGIEPMNKGFANSGSDFGSVLQVHSGNVAKKISAHYGLGVDLNDIKSLCSRRT